MTVIFLSSGSAELVPKIGACNTCSVFADRGLQERQPEAFTWIPTRAEALAAHAS